MSNDIKAGDVVHLKSGGPNMTVAQVGKDQLGTMTVWCEWFDANSKAHKETFSLSAVEKVSAPTNWNRPQVVLKRPKA